jgi:hypothetical protein
MNNKEYMTIKINANMVLYVVQERNYMDDAENTLLSAYNICVCVRKEDAVEACMNYNRTKDMNRYDCEEPFWYKKHESGYVAKILDFKPLHFEF